MSKVSVIIPSRNELPTDEKRKAYKKAWRIRNREYYLSKNREYYARNAEKMRQRGRDYYKLNKQKDLDRKRQQKYGISGDEFRQLVEQQNYRCAVCTDVLEKTLCVDHNHTTGAIRGIICNSCNFAIGHAKDSPERLRLMANYLEKYDD